MDYQNVANVPVMPIQSQGNSNQLNSDLLSTYYWYKMTSVFNDYVIPVLVDRTRRELQHLWNLTSQNLNAPTYNILNFTPESKPSIHLLLNMNFTNYPQLKSINFNSSNPTYDHVALKYISSPKTFLVLGKRLAERRREYLFNHLFLFYCLTLFVLIVCPLVVLLVMYASSRSGPRRKTRKSP